MDIDDKVFENLTEDELIDITTELIESNKIFDKVGEIQRDALDGPLVTGVVKKPYKRFLICFDIILENRDESILVSTDVSYSNLDRETEQKIKNVNEEVIVEYLHKLEEAAD